MCPSLLGDARLYELLVRFDADIAADARARGCLCGGVLHCAFFGRKPRGATVALPEGYDRRASFCCGRRDCRKRTTPPSLRFLGRKVYLGGVVVVVTAMRHGRIGELSRLTGASRATIARWRRWWAEVFSASAFWRVARALFSTPVSTSALPSSLLERFESKGDGERGRLLGMLDFIKPVTSRTARNGESKTMVG